MRTFIEYLEWNGYIYDEWEYLSRKEKLETIGRAVRGTPRNCCYSLSQGFYVLHEMFEAWSEGKSYWTRKRQERKEKTSYYADYERECARPQSDRLAELEFKYGWAHPRVEPEPSTSEWIERYGVMLREHWYCPLPKQETMGKSGDW